MVAGHASVAVCARRIGVAALLLVLLTAAGGASAASYSVLYSFCPKESCPDGQDPANPLIMDGGGNFYGTTEFGGKFGAGTIFMVPAGGGGETVLYSFTGGADGRQPISGLIMDAGGNLYGTTNTSSSITGGGTLYQFTTGGQLNVLVTGAFSSQAGLVMDGKGNIYGTATDLQSPTQETFVFELTPNADMTQFTPKVIAELTPEQGQDARSPLVFDGSGNLYGTTYQGGKQGGGSVFKVSKKHGKWSVKAIYADFCNLHCENNKGPAGAIAFDASGNLYGTASGLGTIVGGGTVWELSPAGTKWKFKILHNFGTQAQSGIEPFGGITVDTSTGILYGTTSLGGIDDVGTIFSLVPGSTFTTLYQFCPRGNTTGCPDGINPTSALITDGSGTFWGTTQNNGANTLKTGGGGTVFQITP